MQINNKFIENLCKNLDKCLKLNKHYNTFWSKFYFIITYTLIPINLIAIQQIFFEDLNVLLLITHILVVSASLSYHLFLNIMSASINKDSFISFKLIQQLYNKFYIKIDLHH